MTRQVQPGWHPDQQGGLRWWDGQRWTEHVQGPPQGEPARGPGIQVAPSPGGRRTGLLIGGLLAAAVVVVGVAAVLWVVLGGGDDDDPDTGVSAAPPETGVVLADIELSESLEDGRLVDRSTELDLEVEGNEVVQYGIPGTMDIPVTILTYDTAPQSVESQAERHEQSAIAGNLVCYSDGDPAIVACYAPLDDGYMVVDFAEVPGSPVPHPADLDEALGRAATYLEDAGLPTS